MGRAPGPFLRERSQLHVLKGLGEIRLHNLFGDLIGQFRTGPFGDVQGLEEANDLKCVVHDMTRS